MHLLSLIQNKPYQPDTNWSCNAPADHVHHGRLLFSRILPIKSRKDNVKTVMNPWRLFVMTPRGIDFLTWMMNKLRLPQMRGAGHEAVGLHRECPAAKQMR